MDFVDRKISLWSRLCATREQSSSLSRVKGLKRQYFYWKKGGTTENIRPLLVN